MENALHIKKQNDTPFPVELFRYPHIRTKSIIDLHRLSEVIDVASTSMGVDFGRTFDEKLINIREEGGRALVNRVYFLQKPEAVLPEAVVVLMNSERKQNQSFERSKKAYMLLENHLPEKSGGVCFVPKLYASDDYNQALILEPVTDNVSWKTPEPVVQGMLESYLALSKIKPDGKNVSIFPYLPIENIDSPKSFLIDSIKGRFAKFYEWHNKVKSGEIEGSDEILKYLQENEVVYKIEEKLQLLEKKLDDFPDSAFADMPDIGFNTSDGNALNFLVNVDNKGNLRVGNIDFDGSHFSSVSLLVASTVWHPQNMQLFEGEEGVKLQRKLLSEYARRNNFGSKQVETLNLIVDLMKFKWAGTIAKNLAGGRSNWRQLYGGLYKTRTEFVVKRELPLLLNFLNKESNVLHVKDLQEKIIYKPNMKVETLVHPYTLKPPVGEFERYVSEKVNNPDEWLQEINKPLFDLNLAYPFTNKEVFVNGEPLLIGETVSAKPLGDGNFLVINRQWSMRNSGSKEARYSYLTRSKEKDELYGGLAFVTGEEKVVANDLKKIKVPKEVFANFVNEVNPQLENRFKNLANIFSKLDDIDSNIEVTNFEINNDSVEFFSIVTASLSDGRMLTMKVNREGRVAEDSNGVVFIAKNKEGKYMAVRQKRPMIPTSNVKTLSSKETIEAARGWVGSNEQPLAEFAQEFGLKGGYELLEAANIAQDYRTDATNLTVYLINVDNKSKSFSFVDGGETDEYFEELLTEELTGQEVIEAIQKGIIRDDFSIYSFGLYMLRSTGELVVDEKQIEGKSIYLQKKFILQEGEFRYVIPQIKKGSGSLIAETLSNSSSARQIDEVLDGKYDDIKHIEGLESVLIKDVVENIIDGVYDAPTASTLILGLLKKGYINYNSTP